MIFNTYCINACYLCKLMEFQKKKHTSKISYLDFNLFVTVWSINYFFPSVVTLPWGWFLVSLQSWELHGLNT